MSTDADSFASGFMFAMVIAFATWAPVTLLMTMWRRTDRSEQACKPAAVLHAGDGVASCSDGRVYRWREGYTVPVGKRGAP
jgi:hypothetical protein